MEIVNSQVSQTAIISSTGCNCNPDRHMTFIMGSGRLAAMKVCGQLTHPSFTVSRKMIESAFSADAGSMTSANLHPHIIYTLYVYTYICITKHILKCIVSLCMTHTIIKGDAFCQILLKTLN